LQGDVPHELFELFVANRALLLVADFHQHADLEAGVDAGRSRIRIRIRRRLHNLVDTDKAL
jgi:hypothetical protein